MLTPGGNILKAIILLLIIGTIHHLLQQNRLGYFFLILAAILSVILLILLILEQHEDRVLNEQALRLERKIEAGIEKKSFLLYYNHCEIWCEHLDSMGDYKEKVIEKFLADYKIFNNITMPTLVAVNLDETRIDGEILDIIISSYQHTFQEIRKVVFVGLNKQYQRLLKKTLTMKQPFFLTSCMNDFEKAKEWLQAGQTAY